VAHNFFPDNPEKIPEMFCTEMLESSNIFLALEEVHETYFL